MRLRRGKVVKCEMSSCAMSNELVALITDQSLGHLANEPTTCDIAHPDISHSTTQAELFIHHPRSPYPNPPGAYHPLNCPGSPPEARLSVFRLLFPGQRARRMEEMPASGRRLETSSPTATRFQSASTPPESPNSSGSLSCTTMRDAGRSASRAAPQT